MSPPLLFYVVPMIICFIGATIWNVFGDDIPTRGGVIKDILACLCPILNLAYAFCMIMMGLEHLFSHTWKDWLNQPVYTKRYMKYREWKRMQE